MKSNTILPEETGERQFPIPQRNKIKILLRWGTRKLASFGSSLIGFVHRILITSIRQVLSRIRAVFSRRGSRDDEWA